jgi:YD repeat-containing protein
MTDATGISTWIYDALGNRRHTLYPGGEVVTYTYDALNRLTHGPAMVIITGASFRAQGPQPWKEVHTEASESV